MNLINNNSLVTLDDLFDSMTKGFGINGLPKRNKRVFVNVVEEKDAFIIELASPGFSKEELEIEVEGNHLLVKGQKSVEEGEGEEKTSRVVESFSRGFRLGAQLNAENFEASYNDGLLSIKMPKKEKKAIEIKSLPIA